MYVLKFVKLQESQHDVSQAVDEELEHDPEVAKTGNFQFRIPHVSEHHCRWVKRSYFVDVFFRTKFSDLVWYTLKMKLDSWNFNVNDGSDFVTELPKVLIKMPRFLQWNNSTSCYFTAIEEKIVRPCHIEFSLFQCLLKKYSFHVSNLLSLKFFKNVTWNAVILHYVTDISNNEVQKVLCSR